MCSSGVGFDPTIDDTTYTFDVAGLYKGLFVMADRQTGSIWTHYDGTVLQGPLADQDIALKIEPMVHTTWADWVERHPATLVLDWYDEFAGRYRDINVGRAGISAQFLETLGEIDDRLPENELVLGAGVGDDFRAYVLAQHGPGLTVLNDALGNEAIVVFLDPSLTFGIAFSAEVDGEVHTFEVDGGRVVDQVGNVWDVEGRATSGPDVGESLEWVTSFVTEWYGWAAYNPDTTIHPG